MRRFQGLFCLDCVEACLLWFGPVKNGDQLVEYPEAGRADLCFPFGL